MTEGEWGINMFTRQAKGMASQHLRNVCTGWNAGDKEMLAWWAIKRNTITNSFDLDAIIHLYMEFRRGTNV